MYQIKLHQISQISSKLFNLHWSLMLLLMPKLHTSPLNQRSLDKNLPLSEYHVWNTAKTLWYTSKNRSICASIPSIKRSLSQWLREKQVIVSHTFTANLSLWFNCHNPPDPHHILLRYLSEDNSQSAPHLSVLRSGSQTKNSSLATTNRPKEELLRVLVSLGRWSQDYVTDNIMAEF